MARVIVQPVLQQKHPTPSQGAWEFHFHPQTLDRAITETIAKLDVGLAGGPLAAWAIEPGFAIWIRSFVAVVPSEQRRYTGVAGMVITPAPGDERAFAGVLPSALARLELPPAQPWNEGAPSTPRTIDVAAAGPELIDATGWAPFVASLDVARELAHALVLGGPAAAPAPSDDRVARQFGTLLSWLPPTARTEPRRGAFIEGGAARAPTNKPAERNLLHYLARSWIPPAELARRSPDFPRLVWRLVADVAESGVAKLFDELTEITECWDAAADLERWLRRKVITADELAACDARAPAPLFADVADAGVLWNRVLNYWGRDFLAVDEARLARVLARRILVDHLFHLDAATDLDLPRRYLRRLDYEALLPTERARALRSALGKIMPTLGESERGAT